MTTWIGAPDDTRTGEEAAAAIANVNDSKYFDPAIGVVKVDEERWRKAQAFELAGWSKHWERSTDRNNEHAQHFNNYTAVPSALGHVCEIGCGISTQLQTSAKNRHISRLTLIDPLINTYKQMKECPYKRGKFNNLPTTISNHRAEMLKISEAFDTIICINVLEHVMDAILVLNNIHRALKTGGTLIFGERSWDDFDPLELFDVGHPIRLRTTTLQQFREKFIIMYRHTDYFIGKK